jgi:two-component sensor histidine kinase
LSWKWQHDKLDLQWEEIDGPPVRQPSATGYGTKVITDSVVHQLRGTAKLDWRPTGLCFAMSTAAEGINLAGADSP